MSNGVVNSVRLAIDVLKCVSDGNYRVTDVSTKLNISKSTAHRLLKTLVAVGMISQDPIKRTYRLGKLIIQLANPLLSSHAILVDCAKEEMWHLRELSGETVILYVQNGKEIVCVEELLGLRPIKYTFGKGNIMPWNVGAASKVLLAELSDADIGKMLNGVELVKYTSRTNTTKRQLLDTIREARLKGYATSFSTYEEGAAAISVSIKNYVMPVALSILGSEKDFGQRIPGIVNEVKVSADKISRKLAEEF